MRTVLTDHVFHVAEEFCDYQINDSSDMNDEFAGDEGDRWSDDSDSEGTCMYAYAT